MTQEKISSSQLIYILLGFESNALILARGQGAQQDAWLAIIIGSLCGLILIGVYIKLFDYYPTNNFLEMIPKIIGKYLSFPLIICYSLYFTYLSSLACRDFGELVQSTILTETPMIAITGSFMVIVVYCLRKGIESFGKMGELIIPVHIMILIISWILMAATIDLFNPKQILPILGNGLKPVLKEVFFDIFTFPFGETALIFSIFTPVLNNKENAKKVAMIVMLFGGTLLSINCMISLCVLGPNIYAQEFFPFLAAIRMVSIADFLERLDALAILILVAGVFFKVGGWTYGASAAICQLFKLPSNHSILIPLATIIAPFSFLLATNYIEHREIGVKFISYLQITFQMVVPLVLLVIASIKKKFESKLASTTKR